MLHPDCCLILPPYPFSLGDPSDMSLEDAYLEARPDQDEMEDAINQFLKGFKDMASMLSQLPKPAQGSVSSISVADAI